MEKILFEYNGFKTQSISFDHKKNILYCNKLNEDGKFIEKIQLTMGQIPKKVKQKIKPLKK